MKHYKTIIIFLLLALPSCYIVYLSLDDICYFLKRDEKVTVRFLEHDHTKKLVPMTSCKEFSIGETPFTLNDKGEVLIPRNSVYHVANNICLDRYYMVKTNESANFLEFEAVTIPVTARFTSPKSEILINNTNELDFTVSLFDINKNTVYVNDEDQLILEAKKSTPSIPFEIRTSTNTIHRSIPYINIGLGQHTASVKYFYKNKKNEHRELQKHSYTIKKHILLDSNDKFISKNAQITISSNSHVYLRAKKNMECSVKLLSDIDMLEKHRVELQYMPTLATPISFIGPSGFSVDKG